MKQTDMEKVKQMAKLFLYFKPQKTKFSPAIISHPFMDSGIAMCRGEAGEAPKLLNILEDESAMKRWRQDTTGVGGSKEIEVGGKNSTLSG